MTALAGWTRVYSGKVRELYVEEGQTLEDAPVVLMVASDRVSAFDRPLEPAIPGKGEALTSLTNWWLEYLDVPDQRAVVAHHAPIPEAVRARATLAKTLDMYPIECVVRGWLAGSAVGEYQRTGAVCGVVLPEGLSEGDRLPEPIFTPAWKAPLGQHDENITFERVVELVGAEVAAGLRDQSIELFTRAAQRAAESRLILVDTKFEFGADRTTGQLTLADEVLTSDSSRYWSLDDWQRGELRSSFDKQIVRNWIRENWDGEGVPPTLPESLVTEVSSRYHALLEQLTSNPQ
ncbi:phosphoribosylaminoimidazolesuccinocarboxamide synthase [Humidisolicoccus flavus]|uniref:phosphoribosylaminoimidazolesuccinocarboxamide synthase n=1 Tax=Humidisolicoccus flavus TaxID=3111414 RepID=UPI003245475C